MNRPDPWSDPAMVAGYAQRPPQQVPGFADIHRMALVLLDEHARADARILVLGAGGGLELKAFTEARPGWRLTGIDPSAPMLDIARETLGSLAARVGLRQGYITDASPGPFDGAACFLVLHFLDRDQRAQTLRALYDRLAPGARLVVAHHSFPREESAVWLTRYAAFANVASADGLMQLPILSPADDEAMLRDAGFRDVALFYAGLNFRGWVAVR